MNLTIRYNRTTNHIEGLAIRTAGGGFNYSKSACATMSRGRLAVSGKGFDNVADALAAARKLSGRKLCKTCEAAALAMIEAETVTEVEAPAATVTLIWTNVAGTRSGRIENLTAAEYNARRRVYKARGSLVVQVF